MLGSARPESRTRCLAQKVKGNLENAGATTAVWDPCDKPLPIANPQFHNAQEKHPNLEARWLAAEATTADAIVWASPLYHNSYSGVLKNALDHLAIPQIAYKPICLLGHGGNRSTQAVDHLRTVARGFLGLPTPTAVCSSSHDYVGDEDPVLSAPDLEARCARASAELFLLAASLRPQRARLLQLASG